MPRDNPAKHFIIPLVIALCIYAISYNWIQHRRVRNGPWQITFTTNNTDSPTIIINQLKIGITNVRVLFTAEPFSITNLRSNSTNQPTPAYTIFHVQPPATLSFDQARQVPFPVPYGECVFMDPTFLPGTLTFKLFNHQIELAPRTLVIDHKEHPWRSGEMIRL